MLSRTAEHAVRAVILLARHYGDRTVGAEEISTQLGVPRNYLSKTLNVLVRAGILTSARGPGGGFVLAVSPDVLTVADVVDVFSEGRPSAVVRCLLEDAPCDPLHPCSAHRRWSRVTKGAREPLLRTVIGELIAEAHPRAVAGKS